MRWRLSHVDCLKRRLHPGSPSASARGRVDLERGRPNGYRRACHECQAPPPAWTAVPRVRIVTIVDMDLAIGRRPGTTTMPYRSIAALVILAPVAYSSPEPAPGGSSAFPDAAPTQTDSKLNRVREVDAGPSLGAADQQSPTSREVETLRPPVQTSAGSAALQTLSAHGQDAHATTLHGQTPLHLAARQAHLDKAMTLLQAGEDVNAEDCTGATPLHAAAVTASNTEMLAMLLAAGAKVDAGDLYDRTPLRFAAESNPNPAAVTTLLSAGADVNSAETAIAPGKTPLHAAAECNANAGVMLALLAAGADVGAVMEYGITPLHLAAEFNTPEVLLLLLEANAAINAPCDLGWTPLHSAAFQNERTEVLSLLLQAGADVNACCNRGDTPLHLAAEFNSPDVISTLVRAGADVDARNWRQETPLHLAAKHNSDPETLVTLLRAGATPCVEDDDGKTALDRARSNSDLIGTEALRMLEMDSR